MKRLILIFLCFFIIFTIIDCILRYIISNTLIYFFVCYLIIFWVNLSLLLGPIIGKYLRDLREKENKKDVE